MSRILVSVLALIVVVSTDWGWMVYGDHHNNDDDEGEPIVIPPGGGREGRRDRPPGYRGGTRHQRRMFRTRYKMCNPSATPRQTSQAYEDWLNGGADLNCETKHAFVCADGLGFLAHPYGPIRHDDVVTFSKSVSMSAINRSAELSGGWFPQNDQEMFRASIDYMLQRGSGDVPGMVRWTSRPLCDSVATTKTHHDRVRGNMRNTTWTTYNFFKENCQHWAAEHVK